MTKLTAFDPPKADNIPHSDGMDDMTANAVQATAMLKALAHEGRMMILCHLIEGEKTVGELETLLDQRQAAVSQQLSRLRSEGLVACRRAGKARLYTIADPRVSEIIGLMYRLFCAK